jgi:hypothetical protein
VRRPALAPVLEHTVEELRAVLAAYRLVKDASWPTLHAAMAHRAAKWSETGKKELRAELAGYLEVTRR